jgi:hypothetical protein
MAAPPLNSFAALFVLSHLHFENVFPQRFTALFTFKSCVYAPHRAALHLAFLMAFFERGRASFSFIAPGYGGRATINKNKKAPRKPRGFNLNDRERGRS